MVTATATRRLSIPATTFVSRERLLMVTPWFLRPGGDPAAAPPALLTFTQDDFIERFFAGVGRVGDAYDPQAKVPPFENLVAYRDYAEPPAAMLDATGAPRYPGSVTRRPTPGQELERDPDDPSKRIEPPDDDPEWLRKLYPGLHRHFHVVTTELVCARHGFPRVGKKRIIDAGFVVRRLVRDPRPQGGTARWQDWIPSPIEGGVWLEIADQRMRFTPPAGAAPPDADPDATGSVAIDPRALSELLFDDAAALRARLGLLDDEEEPPPLTLQVEPLSLVPAAVGKAAEHTALFGYLPLPIGELQRPAPAPETVALLRATLASRARRHLEVQLLGAESPTNAAAADFIENWAESMREPLARVVERTFDLELPTTVAREEQLRVAVTNALDNFNDYADNVVGSPPANADSLIQSLVRRLLVHVLKELADDERAAAAWWTDVKTAAFEDARITTVAGGVTWASEAIRSAQAGDLAIVLAGEARRIARRVIPAPAGATAGALASAAHVRAFLVALLRRVRKVRIELVRDYYRRAYPPFPREQNPSSRLDPPIPDIGLERLPIAVGTLSAELSAWIAADIDENGADARKERPQPWPPLVTPNNPGSPAMARVRIHRACAELERVLSDLDARGAGAGAAYYQELTQRTRQRAAATLEAAGGTASANAGTAGAEENLEQLVDKYGLDLKAQPERGLFIHPTALPGRGDIAAFINEVENRFLAGGMSDGAVTKEAETLASVPLPRYDPDHLYAVWSYARIAGRTPCERERIVWSGPGDVFSVAEPTDILGLRPVPMQLPDLKKLVRDLPRIRKAKAVPVSAVGIPPDSDVNTGDLPIFTSRKFGAAAVCMHGIPVFTICAWVLFTIVYNILKNIPGFTWMQFMKTCIGMPSGE